MTRLAPAAQMGGGLFARGEDAGAFERDVDVHVLPRQFRRIPLGQHLEGFAADTDAVAVDGDGVGKAAVDRIVAQQMRIGLDRAEIVDGDDIDVLAAGFVDGAHDVAPDPPEAVDCDPHLPSHDYLSLRPGTRAGRYCC